MKGRWTPLAIAYLVLSIVGLVGTFILNAWTVVEGRNYFGDIFGSGPAVSSIGVDLLDRRDRRRDVHRRRRRGGSG